MWTDRSALADLDLPDRERVLDVGCGTGVLSAALRAETDAPVIGLDADADLLGAARRGPEGHGHDDTGDGDHRTHDRDGTGQSRGGRPESTHPFPVVRGDALALPVRDDAVDLAACQALLINLVDPAAGIAELARVSSDLVAAIEPDNAAVSVESTVDSEVALERRARSAYLAGVDTDVTLGAVDGHFRAAGLSVVGTRRYDHVREVAPPYDDHALRAARRKATGAGLAGDRETMLAGGLTPETYDELRTEWRAMGRAVVEAMERDEYRRREVVPFHVTVGRV